MGKGIGHGVAKGAQLLFQLLLHLFSLVFLFCIVFTMIHRYFSPFCRCIPADDRTGDPQAVHGGAHNAARISGPLAAGVQPRQLADSKVSSRFSRTGLLVRVSRPVRMASGAV